MSKNNETSICCEIHMKEINVLKTISECQPETNLTLFDENIPTVHDARNIGLSSTSKPFRGNDKYFSSTSSSMNLKENDNKNNVIAILKTNEILPENKPFDSVVNSTSNISIEMADIVASSKNGNFDRIESNTNLNTVFCRICMASGGGLISPCQCKGSLRSVHYTCLQRWLSTSGRTTCELCEGPFPVEITQRYSFQRALVIWLGHFRLTFQTDCLFFCLVSIITIGLVACCLLGSRYMIAQGNQFGISRDFTEIVVDIMLAVVIFGYVAFSYTLWTNHFTVWKRWRNATVDIRLVMEDEPNSLNTRN